MADEELKGTTAPKRPWAPPVLSFDGDLEDLVLGGGGKLTSIGGDGGESRKQPPSG